MIFSMADGLCALIMMYCECELVLKQKQLPAIRRVRHFRPDQIQTCPNQTRATTYQPSMSLPFVSSTFLHALNKFPIFLEPVS